MKSIYTISNEIDAATSVTEKDELVCELNKLLKALKGKDKEE